MSDTGQKPDASPFESSDDALGDSIQGAFLPEALDPEHNELLIERALARHIATTRANSDEPNSVQGIASLSALESNHQNRRESARLEREQAEALALALDGIRQHPLAELAEVIQSAYAPRALPPSLHGQLERQALTQKRSRVVRANRTWWRYVAPAVALAASVTLWLVDVHSPVSKPGRPSASELVRTRSLSPLFAETLEQPTPTQRIDRIYAVRSKELRHNRFALWRVQ